VVTQLLLLLLIIQEEEARSMTQLGRSQAGRRQQMETVKRPV
jgi:hypothetical protein